MPRHPESTTIHSSDSEAELFFDRIGDNEVNAEGYELQQWPLRKRISRRKSQRNRRQFCRMPWSNCDLRHVRRSAACLLGLVLGALITLTVVTVMDWPPDDPFDNALRELDGANRVLWDVSNDAFMEFMSDVSPIPCHSHNDYWRRRPLYAALATGCTSVEADIWYLSDELWVGHSIGELRKNVTLEHLYINPLLELLAIANADFTTESGHGNRIPYERTIASAANGLFRQHPEQTLVLLIDFKILATTSWASVNAALEPLRRRGWLTYWNGHDRISGPVTVVATGDVPFELIVGSSPHRDIFFDAPLDDLPDPNDKIVVNADQTWVHTHSKYNTSNSYYASTSMQKAIGHLHHREMSPAQIDTLQSQIAHARRRGLISRYWGTPRWPRGLRNRIWNMLVQMDVGVLNVNDLRAIKDGKWGSWKSDRPRVTF